VADSLSGAREKAKYSMASLEMFIFINPWSEKRRRKTIVKVVKSSTEAKEENQFKSLHVLPSSGVKLFFKNVA
jgi:hypothetical protein